MKQKIVGIIYIALLYLGLATDAQGIYDVSYNSQYYFGIAITVLCFAAYLINKKLIIQYDKNKMCIALSFFIPFCLIFAYSMVLNLFFPVGYSGYISRSFGLVVYAFLAIAEAYFAFSYFGRKAIYLSFYAVALNYLTSMCVAFLQDGFTQFVSMVTDSSYVGSILEMHEIAPMAALFLFYFLYEYGIEKNRKKSLLVYIAICFVILFISSKRIVIAACFAVIIFYFISLVLKKAPRKLGFYFKLFGIIGIVCLLVFVVLVKTGLMIKLMNSVGINPMARDRLWDGIRDEYSLSILFMGRGLGFVSKWMDNNWMNLNIHGLHASTGLHSDILKYYIEYGFLGFVGYWYYHLVYLTKKIREWTTDRGYILYFLLIVLQILILLTDNVSIYHNFMFVFYLMIFSIIKKKNPVIQMQEG